MPRSIDAAVEDGLTYPQWHAATVAAGVGTDAGELHGLLVGYLCAGGKLPTHRMLAQLGLEVEDHAAGHALEHLLEPAAHRCERQLQGLNMALQLLLPPEDSPLAERVAGLLAWIRGFLGGFGLAGAKSRHLTGDGKELLRDLATIAGSDPTLDEGLENGPQADENAWVELVEFTRVACMLLHAEAAGAARKGSTHG